jgi:hypothetical protein
VFEEAALAELFPVVKHKKLGKEAEAEEGGEEGEKSEKSAKNAPKIEFFKGMRRQTIEMVRKRMNLSSEVIVDAFLVRACLDILPNLG